MSGFTRMSCLLAVFATAIPGRAAAFSDPTAFADDVLAGGGAGKYFTGSPRDPYSCSVCHAGGKTPEVKITGMPDRLVAGSKHDVRIRWGAAKESHALNLELMTKDGTHSGVELTDLTTLPKQERCEQSEDGEPAVFSVDVDRRRILGVQDCGASELRFSFTTPDAPALYFTMGVVRSDGSGAPEGDGVFELRRRITRDGTEADVASGCSVMLASKASGGAAWALASAFLGLWLRRRRKRTSVLAVVIACAGAGCYQPRESGEASEKRDAAIPYVDEFAELLGETPAGDSNEDRDCATASSAQRLILSVRTVSANGRYRPRNVGAIWIEDASGSWVKTLERWGERRAKWLSAFNEASGGDVTDAVTGATLATHKVHEVEWNFTDRAGCEVPDGDYQLRMELTDWSGKGPTVSVAFAKDGRSIDLTAADAQSFRQLQLRIAQ
jgi:hypothetical protein